MSTFTKHSTGNPSHSNQTRKGIQVGKEVKLSLFTDYMIIYIKNTSSFLAPPNKLLELISEFGKI